MSRIGVKPITVPAGVEVTIAEGNLVTVKGPKGTLTKKFDAAISIKQEENTITVERPTNNKQHRSLHGLTRTLIDNMVIGVTNGFEKKLELVGVGYRAQKQGNKLVMNLGFSQTEICAPVRRTASGTAMPGLPNRRKVPGHLAATPGT